jgi:phytoene synthase
MSTSATLAEKITRKAGSNLALSFIALPADRRRDLTIFYAFCRVVDDIADEPGIAPEEKQRRLDEWKRAIDGHFDGEPELAWPLRQVLKTYGIDRALLHEIVAGVGMDVRGTRYDTFAQLHTYCYRVASAVGLVSIGIFGCKNPASRAYAIALGIALQLTNITRDVARDYANGRRIYLPSEDLVRFGYTEADLATRKHSESFAELMIFEADRAAHYFNEAALLLPADDRRALVAAEIMTRIYRRLLDVMRRDGFRVFEKNYALGRIAKTRIIAGVLLRHLLRL